jgi:hypothetical protein
MKVLRDINHPERCRQIETTIKQLSPTQLEELFKILQKNKCEYTINNNGVFLNLSWIEPTLLDKIELFINFCYESKKELDRYEKLCRDLNENLDVKKDDFMEDRSVSDESLEETTIEIAKKIAPKMSSSMKFYLLKKKFSKNTQSTSINNLKYYELSKEVPLMLR